MLWVFKIIVSMGRFFKKKKYNFIPKKDLFGSTPCPSFRLFHAALGHFCTGTVPWCIEINVTNFVNPTWADPEGGRGPDPFP